jgi:hypothetical protein
MDLLVSIGQFHGPSGGRTGCSGMASAPP